jgi:hypothetical protein
MRPDGKPEGIDPFGCGWLVPYAGINLIRCDGFEKLHLGQLAGTPTRRDKLLGGVYIIFFSITIGPL